MLSSYWLKVGQQKQIREQIKGLANNTLEMTPAEFFKMRSKSFGGQARQVLSRVNNHFTGRGNGDVYADYKYGDQWTIKMIALEKSGFKSLNELERNAIDTFDAYRKGYNKTWGNR